MKSNTAGACIRDRLWKHVSCTHTHVRANNAVIHMHAFNGHEHEQTWTRISHACIHFVLKFNPSVGDESEPRACISNFINWRNIIMRSWAPWSAKPWSRTCLAPPKRTLKCVSRISSTHRTNDILWVNCQRWGNRYVRIYAHICSAVVAESGDERRRRLDI